MSCFKIIDKFNSVLLVICSIVIYAQSDVPRPRGVSLSKASLYTPTKDFTCFDGTVTIPFNYVNDDYCDCFDGSDEPGTSACLNGVFHCTNAGHRPQNIPSSRVNDGVCDCCDGTDEYATTEQCSNICENLGREARAEALRMAELLKAGNQVRIDLIAKGNKKRNEMAEQLAQLEHDKMEAEKIKVEKEAIKIEIEDKENDALKVYREAADKIRQQKAEEEQQKNRQEAEDTFARFDADSDGILTISEITVRNVFDKDKDGAVTEEEVKYFLNEHESVDLEGFVTTTWPLLKPFLMMEQGLFRTESTLDTDKISEGENEPESDADGDITEDQDHEDFEGDGEGGEDDTESELPLEDKDDSETEHQQVYDENTQKLVEEASEARRLFTDAERTVREIDSNIRHIKENLEKDYGLQQEYATLDGECFEYEDKEYIYKLCLFQKASQKSKNGGSEIGLGNWGEWAGPEGNQYSIMKYTNGVACWNGPNRSTAVHIHCGLESKILTVTEPFRCEYKMDFSTPAACDDSRGPEHPSHDEL